MAYENVKDTSDENSNYMVEPGIESLLARFLHLALGALISKSLKTNFRTFYRQHRTKLMTSTMLLFLSNISTGVYFTFYFKETWDWKDTSSLWFFIVLGINMYIIPSVI